MTQKMPRELQPRAAAQFATTFRSVGAPAPMPVAAPPRSSGGLIVAGVSLLVVAGLGAGGVWLWTTTHASAAPAASPLAEAVLRDAAATPPAAAATTAMSVAAPESSVVPGASMDPLVQRPNAAAAPASTKRAGKPAAPASKPFEMPAPR